MFPHFAIPQESRMIQKGRLLLLNNLFQNDVDDDNYIVWEHCIGYVIIESWWKWFAKMVNVWWFYRNPDNESEVDVDTDDCDDNGDDDQQGNAEQKVPTDLISLLK